MFGFDNVDDGFSCSNFQEGRDKNKYCMFGLNWIHRFGWLVPGVLVVGITNNNLERWTELDCDTLEIRLSFKWCAMQLADSGLYKRIVNLVVTLRDGPLEAWNWGRGVVLRIKQS